MVDLLVDKCILKEILMINKIKIKSYLYDYEVNFLDDLSSKLNEFDDKTTTFIIDGNVFDLYISKFSNILSNNIFKIDATENNKSMGTVLAILEFWKNSGVKKNWNVVCIGGGITQDVTTIASNLYLRGIQWNYFPTTLLSMCDSCVGGKGGVNFGEVKNQLGLFYPPKNIYVATEFLKTLSQSDIINGWGELLKFSLTNNVDFFEQLKNTSNYMDCDNIDDFIFKGLMIKKDIIEEDEFDTGIRRTLNYGHTFGHALESYTKNAIPHGTAVIWGIDVINYMALKKNMISEKFYLTVKNLIKDEFINKEIVIENPLELFGIIKNDKKVKNNTIYLSMPCAKCKLEIVPTEINTELENLFISYLKENELFYQI